MLRRLALAALYIWLLAGRRHQTRVVRGLARFPRPEMCARTGPSADQTGAKISEEGEKVPQLDLSAQNSALGLIDRVFRYD